MAAEGFLKPAHRQLMMVAQSVPELLERRRGYQAPPRQGKWIKL
jgi:hypothetical protein